MKVALIGFAVENKSVYRHFAAKGIKPVVCDQNTEIEIPEGSESQLGSNYLDNLDRFDIIVRSVGIHPSVILDNNPGTESKITTAINLFFEECKTPIIGVTGTKGKGTTSTLIHRILEAAGKRSLLAGNIGVPALDVLNEAASADFVVLELSSFQLYDVKYSPQIAVCLMVVPEHLNWHSDFNDYKASKSNLFRYQYSDSVAIFNALNDSSTSIAAASPASKKLTYAVPAANESVPSVYTVRVEGNSILCRDQVIMDTNEVKLRGRHNLENVCAAIAATWDITNGDIEAIRSAVSNFSGLEFRLQRIRELDGVQYINDSFSTTPETSIAAIKSFTEPKILIVGGSDKGIPFDDLADEIVASNIKKVLAIGDQGQVIAELLSQKGYHDFELEGLNSMEAIVNKARAAASPGDVVLLSAGAASFGMFKDYKDRGKQFTDAVLSLR